MDAIETTLWAKAGDLMSSATSSLTNASALDLSSTSLPDSIGIAPAACWSSTMTTAAGGARTNMSDSEGVPPAVGAAEELRCSSVIGNSFTRDVDRQTTPEILRLHAGVLVDLAAVPEQGNKAR